MVISFSLLADCGYVCITTRVGHGGARRAPVRCVGFIVIGGGAHGAPSLVSSHRCICAQHCIIILLSLRHRIIVHGVRRRGIASLRHIVSRADSRSPVCTGMYPSSGRRVACCEEARRTTSEPQSKVRIVSVTKLEAVNRETEPVRRVGSGYSQSAAEDAGGGCGYWGVMYYLGVYEGVHTLTSLAGRELLGDERGEVLQHPLVLARVRLPGRQVTRRFVRAVPHARVRLEVHVRTERVHQLVHQHLCFDAAIEGPVSIKYFDLKFGQMTIPATIVSGIALGEATILTIIECPVSRTPIFGETTRVTGIVLGEATNLTSMYWMTPSIKYTALCCEDNSECIVLGEATILTTGPVTCTSQTGSIMHGLLYCSTGLRGPVEPY